MELLFVLIHVLLPSTYVTNRQSQRARFSRTPQPSIFVRRTILSLTMRLELTACPIRLGYQKRQIDKDIENLEARISYQVLMACMEAA